MSQNSNDQIVVRFPPSPTGEWHFGNIRTFVFNYLFARKNKGKIVMRFEDTDTARNKEGSDKLQLDLLKAMGMDFDEGPYYQSKRKDIYKRELLRIIAEGSAYEAEENQSGTGRVIRIKNPKQEIVWHDLIKGEIRISSDSFKDENGNYDFIIARSIDDPLYHFTVVVDDYEMGITHVLRGEDHVTSTPRQMIIFKALGAQSPKYGHLPTILSSENGKKLGKRNGAVPVREYLEASYLPDALLNMISLLGWNPGDDQEIFTRDELIKAFSLEKVQKNPAIFTMGKLDWINKEHIKLLDQNIVDTEISSRLLPYIKNQTTVDKLLPMVKEKISKWKDVDLMCESGDLDFFLHEPRYDMPLLICPPKLRKDAPLDYATVSTHLKKLSELLGNIDQADFTSDNIKNAVWDYATESGRGIVLWAMRVALSGKEKSPDPFLISDIIGKQETLSRLAHASNLS